MKFFALIVMCCLSAATLASGAVLIPVITPSPAYPRELLKKRYTGKVVVNLTISAFGSVQSTKIIESSHPELAVAAQQAMVKWRFKPWDIVDGRPANVDITVPIIFGARGFEPFTKEITVGVENTLCAYLNQEVYLSGRNFPEAPLKVDVFWHTRKYLKGSYVAHLVPDPEKRDALITELERAIPEIVQACKQNPDSRYADHLPHEIRGVLVSYQRRF